jgi:cell division transport system permease protein
LLGALSLGLIAATTAVIITLAAGAALAANAQVIQVLRLVGATDAYIADAFVRRFTLRAGAGALAGVALGMLALLALPSAGASAGILTGIGLSGFGWLLPLAVPPLAAAVAFVATRMAARRSLEGLT